MTVDGSPTFQSTPPVRGATSYVLAQAGVGKKFQSTPPVRGATEGRDHLLPGLVISIHAPRAGGDVERVDRGEGLVISIHAPRAGGDAADDGRWERTRYISIHAPRAGGDGGVGGPVLLVEISIHAPRAGGDFVAPCVVALGLISIHAPRAGGDLPWAG